MTNFSESYSNVNGDGDIAMSAAPETLPAVAAASRSCAPSLSSVGVTPSIAPPPSRRPKHTVHWFRKGLRLHDNPSLREGLKDAVTFRCIFIIDPWFASSSNVGINKWRFLLQCLEDLDTSLKKLNSRLFVVRGQPADALPKLFRSWGTTTLSFEEDPEPYGRVRDHNITTKCREVGINVISQVSHTLYKLDSIIELNGGKAPLTYHQFQALIASMPPPPQPEVAISVQALNGATTPIAEDHEERYGVPTLEELGFETEGLKPPVWIGGESEALARLERHLERKAWVASFGHPKMTPQSLLASQTGLSPYMRFGCLSTRLFYYQLTELYKRIKRERPPLSLHGQILWREFFYCAATRNPNFDRMEGNPICVQIPWEKNPDALTKWANGQTGFPWIDSIMIQLREEGWIHHLARHAVACFLTRGDLWISWEEGMKVFDELLLDADWSVNAGMWMWLSCSSFFQQFFHCYCPVRFGRKTDPNGDFIRRYIPALKNMPTRYIHEPWVAPEAVQVSARCIIGRDYPLPVVDHGKASYVNIERIKQVYAQLAKYRPPGNLNPNPVARPNVMQSSPSPTSVIASINQSNYLCSQAAEPLTTSAPTYIPHKDIVFQTHGKTLPDKPSPKQVYNEQKSNNASETTRPLPHRNGYAENLQPLIVYKANQRNESQPSDEQQKFDYKNYPRTSSNYIVQNYAITSEELPRIQQITRNGIVYAQIEMKSDRYENGKVKFYMPAMSGNGIRLQNGYVHPEVVQKENQAPLSPNYSTKINPDSTKDQQNSNEGSLLYVDSDKTFPHAAHHHQKFSENSNENKDNRE